MSSGRDRQSNGSPTFFSLDPSTHQSLEYSQEPILSPGTRADQSDLDPAAFLKTVRELSEKREREDTERFRRLEEEIEKSRQERAKRREERARSISPAKVDPSISSNAGDLNTPAAPTTSPSMEKDASQRPASGVDEVPEFKGFGSLRNSKVGAPSTQSPSPASDPKPSPSASSLARSGTLSWQRRPTSRAGGPRPLSMAAAESTSHSRISSNAEMSRDEIAASLGARDASYFRQTPDRGLGSAAYRRSAEDTTATTNTAAGRRGLPGMSRDSPIQRSGDSSPAQSESTKSEIKSRPESVREGSRTPTSSKPDLKSLIAADREQDEAAPKSYQSTSLADEDGADSSRTPTMSSSQARLANATKRPSSPTKGMGGFVQSAMLRRSDSASKRWSGQPAPGIGRQGSVLSSHSGYGGLQGSHSMPKMQPAQEEGGAEQVSRPNSSGSNGTAVQTQEDKDASVRPGRSTHSRSKSVASAYSTSAQEGHTSPPPSPSKRFRSPTKSSWLESAITSRPESPKPAPSRNSQPAWMADIAKAKAQRASTEVSSTQANNFNDRGDASRSGSPVKEVFGQSILRRSESKDLSRPSSRASVDRPTSSGSPIRTPLGREGLKRTDSDSIGVRADVTSPPVDLKPATPRGKAETLTQTADGSPMTANQREVGSDPPQESSHGPKKEPESKNKTPGISEEVLTPQGLSAKEQPQPAGSANSSRFSTTKPGPETPTKPTTDFRSTLRSRPRPESKQEDTPEFLSKVGALRRTHTQSYIAPDILKDNITRGKADLTKTDGPVKSPRKDELKDSLLAKKEQWKQEERDGVVHERKTSGPPPPEPKPEALAKREGLGRAISVKRGSTVEKPRDATPEAMARQASLKNRPKPVPETNTTPSLQKQVSEPAVESSAASASFMQPKKQLSTPIPSSQPKQTEASKLAARFNPGLAGLLARGPPAASTGVNSSRKQETSGIAGEAAMSPSSAPTEPSDEGGQLQDVRKGRAKGPKRRAAAGTSKTTRTETSTAAAKPETAEASAVGRTRPVLEQDGATSPPSEVAAPVQKAKPRALPGSAASIMMASIQRPSASTEEKSKNPTTPAKSPVLFGSKPDSPSVGTPKRSPLPSNEGSSAHVETPVATQTPKEDAVPDFKGFGSLKKSAPASKGDDDKENAGEGSPSVKSTASLWGKQPQPTNTAPPSQIQLPSKKDEEAAMRSAGLLASSHGRPESTHGAGVSANKTQRGSPVAAGMPPKPLKSSRVVSGQLQDTSPNKGALGSPIEDQDIEIKNEVEKAFGCVPVLKRNTTIDAAEVIASNPHQERTFKTLRKAVQIVSPDGGLQQLPPQEEYTFFDECVYICSHTYTVATGPKKTEIFTWVGNGATESFAVEAHVTAKSVAKDAGNAFLSSIRQGLEPPGFLQALGGILITRRGTRRAAPKQYMICGRKHLGQIVFDEVDFAPHSLCAGYAYLISYPVTLQESKFYLWKGRACSAEEVSAARLAAMDLSATGDIIEVDDGAEFASFLKCFGPQITKQQLAAHHQDPASDHLWRLKALSPNAFSPRLFRFTPKPKAQNILTSFFSRRSSSVSTRSDSPSATNGNTNDPQIKVEAKELSPFTPADFDPEALHLLDAFATLYLLPGPLFASAPTLSEPARASLLSQALLFATEYAELVADGARPDVPGVEVALSGVPQDVKRVLRGWEEKRGLWGTGGLMAGSEAKVGGLRTMRVEEVVRGCGGLVS